MSTSVTRTDKPTMDPAQPVVPRKRRRRAPATGATEDCFTCRKRQVKCDRKRPYCAQCIELGRECSGYRTTLTWGVGVASRGKLRGMSCPVAKVAPSATSAAREPKTPTATAKEPPTSDSTPTREFNFSEDVRGNSPLHSPAHTPSIPDLSSYGASSPIPIPSPAASHPGWHVPGYGEHVDSYTTLAGKPAGSHFHPRPLQRLHTAFATPSYDESTLSASSGPLSAYSDSMSDYGSPREYPQTPEEYQFMEPSLPSYDHYFPPQTAMSTADNLSYSEPPRSYPTSSDEMSSSISSDQSYADHLERVQLIHTPTFAPTSYPEVFGNGGMQMQHPESGYVFNTPKVERSNPVDATMSGVALENSQAQHHSDMASLQQGSLLPSVPQNIFTAIPSSFPTTTRMRSLMEYYDKAICPVLVAFDGPANPYRAHVLQLAIGSESLQNAIAALSMNNMRMRNMIQTPLKQRRRLTVESIHGMAGSPTNEETMYKSLSVNQLNAQLADPVHAKDDSVLAALLVLCLFHVCDSGFSKFRTQLAGVQKLLSMRSGSIQSSFVGWVELFFTWLDVITSTVNDREAQIQGESLDMLDLNSNLGALEHLAGCEGRLFKLIARLGRLNLLSQNRPVRETELLDGATPRASPQVTASKLVLHDRYDNLDGNGWGSPIVSSPTTIQLDPTSITSSGSLAQLDDSRVEFWSEWRDIRSRLENWIIDSISTQSANASTPAQQDIFCISESFRYAALLYTERLAHPSSPSTAPNIQALVSHALHHIRQIGITSCVNKFLLWPLFIAGTECVRDDHRQLVRERCIEIYEESGFVNNLSGLEVLERVWGEADRDARQDSGVGEELRAFADTIVKQAEEQQQAFRWRRAMDRVDGEYIVI